MLAASMVNATGSLRVNADLYNADSGVQLGPSVQVTGSADSIPALLDQLSVEVLRRTPLVAGVVSLPQVDVARAITASPAALKAYLSGDEFYRRSRWQQAVEQFNRATELDSTFALAWYRLALTHGWLFNTVEQREYARRALRFSARLPEREQILLRGLEEMVSGNTGSVDTFREYTRRYPDDVEGWTLLGNARYLYNGIRLEPLDQFRDAYDRALELGPYFGPAYVHLLGDAFQRVDSAALRRLLAGYREIDATSEWCIGNELAHALAFGDSLRRQWATTTIDTLAEPTGPLMCTSWDLTTSPQYHEPLQAVIGTMMRPDRPAGLRNWADGMRIADRINRGRIREARRILDTKMQPLRTTYALSLQVMLHALMYPDSISQLRTERALEESPYRQTPFWAGVLAAEDGRTADVQRAVRQLEERARTLSIDGDSLGASASVTLARALELYVTLRSRPDDATARRILDLLPGLGDMDDGYAGRLLRFEAGRALLTLGQPAEAGRLFESFGPEEMAGEYVTPVEYYRGRVAEDLKLPEAKLHYQRFLDWWDGADSELDPWLDDARQRIRRLVAEPAGDDARSPGR